MSSTFLFFRLISCRRQIAYHGTPFFFLLLLASFIGIAQAKQSATENAHPAKATAAKLGSEFDKILSLAAVVVQPKSKGTATVTYGQLEKLISRLVKHTKKTTENNKLGNPVSFDSDRILVVNSNEKIAHARDTVIIAQGKIKIASALNCLIITDEFVEVSHARDCLIVTRGVVDIGHGRRNLIVAGQFIATSHDGGLDQENANQPNGSILVSGAVVELGFANNTIVSAPLAASVSSADNCTFINCPNRRTSRDLNSSNVVSKASVFPKAPSENMFLDSLEVANFNPPDDSGEGGFVTLRRTNVETNIDIGDSIPSNATDSKGWKLTFVGQEAAVFTKDGQHATVVSRD